MNETRQKNTNVNFIKLMAAMLVILCHSYPLTGNGVDFFSDMTKGKFDFGTVGVVVFFTYSGFFLTSSLSKKKRFATYMKRRMARIFPPLIFVVLWSAFLLGPIFTDLSLKGYFSDLSTYRYLLNMFLLPVHTLPGVFENAPYNATVNGSLWTLPVEFGCYILLYYVVFLEKKFKKWDKCFSILFLLILLMTFSRINILIEGTPLAIFRPAFIPIQTFFMGHVWWHFHDRLTFDIRKFVILSVLLTIAARIREFNLTTVFILVFQYLILSIVYTKQWLPSGMWENLSYNIYLWGFPIGQIVVELSPDIHPIFHFIITFSISYVLAWFINKLERMQKGLRNESINNRC